MLDRRGIILAAELAALSVVGLWSWSCHARHQAVTTSAQADQSHIQAVASAAKAQVYDQEAIDGQEKLDRDAATIARLKADLEKTKRASHASVPKPGASAPSGPPVLPEVPTLPDGSTSIVAKQDAVIAALTQENQDLRTQAQALTLARDSWKAAYLKSEQEAGLRQMALQAQIAAVKAERWKGRLEGLAVGLGVGYVGGRLH